MLVLIHKQKLQSREQKKKKKRKKKKKKKKKKRARLPGFSLSFVIVATITFFDKYPIEKRTKLPLLDLFKFLLSSDNPFNRRKNFLKKTLTVKSARVRKDFADNLFLPIS